jgi:hypothetical protein
MKQIHKNLGTVKTFRSCKLNILMAYRAYQNTVGSCELKVFYKYLLGEFFYIYLYNLKEKFINKQYTFNR